MFSYYEGRVIIHRADKKGFNAPTEKQIKSSTVHNDALLNLPPNDSGNARRFMLFAERYVKYNKASDEWLYWNGKYWDNDAFPEIIQLAQWVMDKYYSVVHEACEVDKQRRSALEYHARTSNNYNSLVNMLCLLKNMNYINGAKCKPYYLNTVNGVVNLKNKQLLPHNPDFLCTNMCKYQYNPSAQSTRFKSFINEIMCGNKNLAKYLQCVLGYCITGSCSENKMFFFKGQGANGKSKLMEAVENVMGNYFARFPISALTKSHISAGHPTPELVPLINKRIAYSSELKADNQINDSILKTLTGSSKIMVRKMRKEYKESDVMFKIIVDTNFIPNFKFYDYATERRIVIIPFDRVFKNGERDLQLHKKLADDGEYILKWLVDGAYSYYEQKRLQEPPEIAFAISEFKRETDSIGCFIKDVLTDKCGGKIKSSVLYERYRAYCYENGFSEVDIKSFSQGMVNRNYRRKSQNSGSFFIDIDFI